MSPVLALYPLCFSRHTTSVVQMLCCAGLVVAGVSSFVVCWTFPALLSAIFVLCRVLLLRVVLVFPYAIFVLCHVVLLVVALVFPYFVLCCFVLLRCCAVLFGVVLLMGVNVQCHQCWRCIPFASLMIPPVLVHVVC